MRKIILLFLLQSVLWGGALAQSTPIYTFSSGGGATGANWPATSIPTFFGSIGQPMVLPRNVFTDNGGGVMVGANFMFAGGTGDNTPPVITYNINAPPTVSLIGTNISVVMTDNNLVGERVYYRPILGGKFQQVNMSAAPSPANTYTASIAVADSMGVEFYFKAFDSQNVTTDPSDGTKYYSYTSYTKPEAPLHRGNKAADYRIISTPFAGSGESIFSLYPHLPNVLDGQTYRLWQYNAGTWSNDSVGGFSQFSRGQGYFLIVDPVKGVNINLTMDASPTETSPPNNRAHLFTMPLTSDAWNLIGNPYPVEINWDSVMVLNGSPASVGQLHTFNGSYAVSTTLGAFQGGFVKVTGSAPSNFKIGLGKQNVSGGRVASISSNLSSPEWAIPFTLTQGDAKNTLAGIGMNPLANQGLDRFDDFNPPAVFDFIDFISQRPELNVNDLTLDVVNTQSTYIWRFQSKSNSGAEAVLKWDNSGFGSNGVPLFLYDVSKNEVIDMRGQNSYSFSPSVSREFKIYYGIDMKDISPDEILASVPFPNPFNQSTEFDYALPGINDNYQVELEIFNTLGQKIRTLVSGNYPSGRYSTVWNGLNDEGAKATNGIYVYHMIMAGRQSKTLSGRVIVDK